ncbi:MAG: hypothetical protein FWD62_15535 [Betaproteobacteria bacterium]|nr:hypothetical protein [Betaproteobacteria bacterium]
MNSPNRFQMLLLALLILLLVPLVLVLLLWFGPLRGNSDRFMKIALPLDCAGNGAMNGDWTETISSRAGRKWPRFAAFINWLFQDPRHCEMSVEFTQSYLKSPLQ